MKFQKGQKKPPGSGRKRGGENRHSRDVKKSILKTYGAIGGDSAMARWARKNQTDFYTRIVPRLIPRDAVHVDISDRGPARGELSELDLARYICFEIHQGMLAAEMLGVRYELPDRLAFMETTLEALNPRTAAEFNKSLSARSPMMPAAVETSPPPSREAPGDPAVEPQSEEYNDINGAPGRAKVVKIRP